VNEDFRDLLRALCDVEARFLVVGAYGLTGVSFDEAWATRVDADYGGVRFPLIGRDALIKNKAALRRPKDLLDLELLEQHKPQP
jgi:hypothetical protein